MKCKKRWIIAWAIMLAYFGSYLFWSRIALSAVQKHGSDGYYFLPMMKSGQPSPYELSLRLFYAPCVFIDIWIDGGPASAPLVDLS